jgi:thiosulfate/3-mercaptopyruvate sulfurtransferase
MAQNSPASKVLVSTAWLADHLNDPKVVVLEVDHEMGGMDMGTPKHIPGARRADLNQIQVKRNGLNTELPPDETLKQIFQALGVNDDTLVVLYSPMWYPMVTRVFFTLDYMGHSNVALLDGSLQQWLAEKRPTVSSYATAPAPGHITLNVHRELLALLPDVKTISAGTGSKAVLLDSRPEKRYTDGHIAGAQHIFWEETVVDPEKPVFKSPDELRKLFAAKGISPGTKVVTYCEIGYQATHDYFVAKYLGFPAAMYDGSVNEWEGKEKLPLVKGSALR